MQTTFIQRGVNADNQASIAGLGERIGAFVIDAVILTLYTILMGVAFFNADVEDFFIWCVFVVIPLVFYSLIFEILMNGQTPGKRAMQLTVVSNNGEQASAGQLVIRWIFLIGGFYIFSGVIAAIVVAANGKGQRLGDIVAGTKVVRIYNNGVSPVAPYTATYPMAKLLAQEDVELIERALHAERHLDNLQPVQMVSEKVKWMLSIDSKLPPSDFLSLLLNDYKHFQKLD